MKGLTEDKHYYLNENGYVVLTEQYPLGKGYYCGNGCKHCPYQYENVPGPGKPSFCRKKRN